MRLGMACRATCVKGIIPQNRTPRPRVQFQSATSGLRKGHTLARRLRPPGQVLLRPGGERALASKPARRAGQAFSLFVEPRLGDRGKEAEIDVHRLGRARASVDRLEMTAGEVIVERADRRG